MISKLIAKIKETGAPVVVGLDPQEKFLPPQILREAQALVESRAGELGADDLSVAAEAFFHFNKNIIDAVADIVPAVKPQVAMYEQLGVPGMEAFWKTVSYAHEKGLIVIGDVKRGDIGSTSEAYARAHIGTIRAGGMNQRVFNEDFATVNPYLGTDGIKPFLDVCNTNDRGIFVLVKTSNPSSGELQDVKLEDGRTVYELVGDKVNEWGALSMDGDYSNVGAVVGATYPEQGAALRKRMPHTYILVPGYGAQGGTAKDVVPFFNPDGLGAIVNSSRGIIAAYTKAEYSKYGPEGYAEAARAAALDMVTAIRTAMKEAGLPTA